MLICRAQNKTDYEHQTLTITRSQAVARIADRTASQDSSNYNDCVNRPSIL